MTRSARAKREPFNFELDEQPVDRAERDCGAHASAPHRAQFAFTEDENRALDLTRLILDMHRGQSHEPWLASMQLAEGSVGPFEGAYLVARVTAFVRALLAERERPYAYMMAGCMHVSPDEIDMMRVMRLARTGPFKDFRAATEHLAGRGHVCRLLAAAASLAQPDSVRMAASGANANVADEADDAAASPTPVVFH